MVVYDYSQIETLMTCGDIHGDYKRFFNEIKTHVKSNKKIDEEIHPLIKEEAESKMLNESLLSNMCFTCDMPRLKNKLKSCENCVIIVAGDCGFGFNKPQYYHDLFHKYNEIFEYYGYKVILLEKFKPGVDFRNNQHLIDEEELDSFDIVSFVSV